MIVMPPGAPQAAVDALRTAIARVNADKAYAEEAEKTFGFVPQWAAGRRHARGGADRAHRAAGGQGVPDRLHEEPAEVILFSPIGARRGRGHSTPGIQRFTRAW